MENELKKLSFEQIENLEGGFSGRGCITGVLSLGASGFLTMAAGGLAQGLLLRL